MKKIYIASILVVSLFAILFMSFGEDAENAYAETDTIIFTGVDTSCSNCTQQLDGALQNILGIEKYTINQEENSIEIVFDPSQMKPEWISKSLEASGVKFEEFQKE